MLNCLVTVRDMVVQKPPGIHSLLAVFLLDEADQERLRYFSAFPSRIPLRHPSLCSMLVIVKARRELQQTLWLPSERAGVFDQTTWPVATNTSVAGKSPAATILCGKVKDQPSFINSRLAGATPAPAPSFHGARGSITRVRKTSKCGDLRVATRVSLTNPRRGRDSRPSSFERVLPSSSRSPNPQPPGITSSKPGLQGNTGGLARLRNFVHHTQARLLPFNVN